MGCWLPKISRELTRLGSQITQNQLQYQGQNDHTHKYNTNAHSYLTEKRNKSNKCYKPEEEKQLYLE